MLRSFLILLSRAGWAQRLITRWGFAWKMASRFIAGETPEAAIRVVKKLNALGIRATLDHLGENTQTREDAIQAAEEILLILEKIQQAEAVSNVSIKLSQIGFLVDEALCRENLVRILDRAKVYDNFVRIDMEDSSFVDGTLRIYWDMRRLGFENLGVVIQAYLVRSESDVHELMTGQARVRLVKGAYLEPERLIFPKKSQVDQNYDRLAEILLDHAQPPPSAAGADGRFPPLPAIATHDPNRIQHVRDIMRRMNLPKECVEFQMLYGIRRDLQDQLVSEGYPLRIYIPYGVRWYPYFMRRLAERPANVWFFLSNLLRR